MSIFILSIVLLISCPDTANVPELPIHIVKKCNEYYGQKKIAEEQLECLAMNIYYEARSESNLGRMAVALTTLRRVELDQYPDDICGVVYKYKAFSWAYLLIKNDRGKIAKGPKEYYKLLKDRKRYPKPGNKKIYAKIKKIAKKAIRFYPKSNWKADHYHYYGVSPKWISDEGMEKLYSVESHIFYQRYDTFAESKERQQLLANKY